MAPARSAANALLASIWSALKLALTRVASVLESLASGSIHSGLTVPGSCNVVLPTAATWLVYFTSAFAIISGVILGMATAKKRINADSS